MTKLFFIVETNKSFILSNTLPNSHLYSFSFQTTDMLIAFLKSLLKRNKSIVIKIKSEDIKENKHILIEDNNLIIGIELKNTLENYSNYLTLL